MGVFFISDTHFGHENIIKYCDRPFTTVKEMNEKIIKNWNSVVKRDDIVYFLGDFCFGDVNPEKMLKKLNGKKRMILGNHDRIKGGVLTSLDFWKSVGFEIVYDRPVVYNDYFILSHFPINGSGKNYPFLNIHGHIHNSVLTNGNYFNVCVEEINYTPISIDKIRESCGD